MEKILNETFVTTNLPVWLQGQEDIVFCSSVCLNRNVKGFKFPYKASPEELRKVGARILGKVNHSALSDNFKYSQLSDMSFALKSKIYERRITYSTVSLDERDENNMTVLISQDETSSIIINGDDHLQVRVTLPGYSLRKCHEKAEDIMKQISMDFSNIPPFGYLTSSPAIMGSGLQIEVMSHLPGISLLVDPDKWIGTARASGIMPEGFWGYGSEPLGNIFTLCSKNTHRREVEKSIEDFEKSANKIFELENSTKKEMDLLEKKDVVMRAYGTMKYMYNVEVNEALSGLSLIKMGIREGIIKEIDEAVIDKLMFYVFPSELQDIMNCDPDSSGEARANLIRKAFSVKKKGE
jgi:protein arginine kinase